MVLVPPGVEAVLCVTHLGLWSLGWAAGKHGWSGLCQTSSPTGGSPAVAIRGCVEKWWLLTFFPEANSWKVLSDLVNVQGYLRVNIIFGVKCQFSYQLPSVAGHERVPPEPDFSMVPGRKAAGV